MSILQERARRRPTSSNESRAQYTKWQGTVAFVSVVVLAFVVGSRAQRPQATDLEHDPDQRLSQGPPIVIEQTTTRRCQVNRLVDESELDAESSLVVALLRACAEPHPGDATEAGLTAIDQVPPTVGDLAYADGSFASEMGPEGFSQEESVEALPSEPEGPYVLVGSESGQEILPPKTAILSLTKAAKRGVTLEDLAQNSEIKHFTTQTLSRIVSKPGGLVEPGLIGELVHIGSQMVARKRTLVMMLPGPASYTALPGAGVSLEVFYGDIPGVNPDAYVPMILGAIPTRNNMRVISSQGVKTRMKRVKAHGKPREEAVALPLEYLKSGHARIEISELPAGEYVLVLRNVDPQLGLEAMVAAADPTGFAEQNPLEVLVWDFTIPEPMI